jgi:hypothetical protein
MIMCVYKDLEDHDRGLFQVTIPKFVRRGRGKQQKREPEYPIALSKFEVYVPEFKPYELSVVIAWLVGGLN